MQLSAGVTHADAIPVGNESWFVRIWRGPRLGMRSIATTLLVLISVVIAGSIVIGNGATDAQRAVRLNSAYQHAASGVAAEESLERKYRLEPSSVQLALHHAAGFRSTSRSR